MEKEIYRNRYVTVQETDTGYVYIKGKPSVHILVINSNTRRILIRKEKVCLWEKDTDGLTYCSLTGTIEDGETVEQTLIKELWEEAGIQANSIKDFIKLGKTHKSKNHKEMQYNYAFDAATSTFEKLVGDGSEGEAGAKIFWTTKETILEKIKDPNFFMSLYLLEKIHKVYL
jgi:8-oxo-dGTP pyrophosphatase MutT (NUDIX family)